VYPFNPIVSTNIMPIPFVAASSLGAMTGQSCEHHHSDYEQPNDDRTKTLQCKNGRTSVNQQRNRTALSSKEALTASDFSSSPKDTNDVRSIEYESSQSIPTTSSDFRTSSMHGLMGSKQSFRPHVIPTSRINLPTTFVEDRDDDEENMYDSNQRTRKNEMVCDAYLDASFHSGLVASIPIDEGCFAVAASCVSCGLLAVGIRGAIQLYSSSSRVLVATITLPPTTSTGSNNSTMTSALAWLDEKNPQNGSRYTLVATTMQGRVSVYTIDPELIEVEGGGIQLLPGGSWELESEVRSVALTNTIRQGMVTAVVGDASGRLHILSWPVNGANPNSQTTSSVIHKILSLTPSAILNVKLNEDGTHLALSTENGDVDVYRIIVPFIDAATTTTPTTTTNSASKRATSTTCTTLVWSTQRAGPVRALSWQGTHLVLGGYDKSCVLVDTNVWSIAREISLEGTVRERYQ